MRLRDFENHLRRFGCVLLRHGGGHDIWINPANNQTASVPRHHEVKLGLARGICRQLAVPLPDQR